MAWVGGVVGDVLLIESLDVDGVATVFGTRQRGHGDRFDWGDEVCSYLIICRRLGMGRFWGGRSKMTAGKR